MAVTTRYGLQVDAWGALVMEKAYLAEEVEQLTIDNVKDRELEQLTVIKEPVSLGGAAKEHVVFAQDLGGGGRATTILRLGSRGKDLDISWRLFERNVTKDLMWGMSQGTLLVVGSLLTIVGLGVALIFFGSGICMMIPGIAMMGAAFGWWRIGRKSTTAGTTEQFESRSLAQAVHWSLMKALANKGISNQQVQLLQQTNTTGLGKLMPTDVLDQLSDTPKIKLG